MRLLPLESLRRPGRPFERVRSGIREHRGQANVWIFPFYSDRYVFDPRGNFTPDFASGRLAGATDHRAYRRFSAKLAQVMRDNLLPLFIFIDPRDTERTDGILTRLQPHASFAVQVPTQTDFAIPTLGKNGHNGTGWKALAGVMERLDVKRLNLLGELGFSYRREPAGCVYAARQNLAKRLSAPVTVLKELIFPNVDLAATS